MPDSGGGDPSPAELSRRMREVLDNFKSLVESLENKYLLRQIFELWQGQLSIELERMRTSIGKKADETDLPDVSGKVDRLTEFAGLEKRVSALEEANKWLMRIVITFVVLGVLAAAFTAGTSGGGGK